MSLRHCDVCERRCRLDRGRSGACGLYTLQDGRLVERFADRFLVACPISIETMPVLHFRPGAKFFQISTTGCNFDCSGCISTVLVREMLPDSPALKQLSAETVVNMAEANGCEGVVFLMNDPLAAFPRFLRIAEKARSRGLAVGCSSNAYFTTESLAKLMPWLDFINIGMKGFSDAAYQACGAAGIGPVLRNLAALHEAGVHVEVSCILTRDNGGELRQLARHIRSLSAHIPLQVMRFLPFESAAIEAEPSVREAEEFCRTLEGLLDYVYLFNTPGSQFLDTHCPGCGQVVLHREFYGPMGAKLHLPEGGLPSGNRCLYCGRRLPFAGRPVAAGYQEGDFEGGYPLTRAMEMVEAMLIAIGVTRRDAVVRAWEEVLQDGGLQRLHRQIQYPRTYIEILCDLGRSCGAADRAETLARYLQERLERIETALAPVTRRPRVYYAMAKPLFYINGGRMENQLVELAGGISLNKQLPPGGRPGRSLTAERFNALDPEIIFISAFLSNQPEDFYLECRARGLTARAVQDRRIYVHPSPGWDFGSPRWILGLMYLAAVFHPQHCAVDIMAEAREFYRRFYGIDFSPGSVNRSFAKPAHHGHWQEGQGSHAGPAPSRPGSTIAV